MKLHRPFPTVLSLCSLPTLGALALLALLAGCSTPPAPTVAFEGGDLIIHHQLDYFKLLSGTQVMFRDEIVVRFIKTPAVQDPSVSGAASSPTAPREMLLAYQHNPATQAGSERIHPYMLAPMRPMPELEITPERNPPELPQATQAYRVTVGSHWDNHQLRSVDAETEWVVGLDSVTGRILFQLIRESTSELTDTSYTWQNHSQVIPLAGDDAELLTVGVGEYSQESLERVRILQEQVPALGEALRDELRNQGD